ATSSSSFWSARASPQPTKMDRSSQRRQAVALSHPHRSPPMHSPFSTLPESYSGGMALVEAIQVITDHAAREAEAHRETREAAIRDRCADLMHHADMCQQRADRYDRWAS